MVDVLRRDPGSLGVCSGVGMHMTKHVYGVYSSDPPSITPRPDEAGVQQTLHRRPTVAVTHPFSGEATIATYTVLHGRDGGPDWGLVVCDLADGTRCYGKVLDASVLHTLEQEECVGRRVELTQNDSVNEVTAWAL